VPKGLLLVYTVRPITGGAPRMNENFQNIEKKGSICCFFYFTGMGTPIHGVVVGARSFFSDDAAVATATAITTTRCCCTCPWCNDDVRCLPFG